MPTLHTFGCSITQGFALPDVVRPITDSQGRPLSSQQIQMLGSRFNWEDVHLYQPSMHAWPQVLADRLGVDLQNHARRGACTFQISRQCAAAATDIQAGDTVIVMWTYLSRISLQWPARTAVPLCNIVDPFSGWITKILPGFNRFFGLSRSDTSTVPEDRSIHEFIQDSAKYYLDPRGIYDRYHNSLLMQTMTAGFLDRTGARIIHLSVEPQTYLDQLDAARRDLDPSLQTSYSRIPDPSIPPAENDMHPSMQHHSNFADHVYVKYFQGK